MKSQRSRLMKRVKEDASLKGPQKTLLYALAASSKGGETVMTVKKLALAAGICERTAHTHLRELQRKGYLSMEGNRGRGKANHYHLMMEEESVCS